MAEALEQEYEGGSRKITLRAPGIQVQLLTLGATLYSCQLDVAGDGQLRELVLSRSSIAQVKDKDKSPYCGMTCGRVANRIARGRFELDGKSYKLAVNNGPNHLHGGDVGWSHKEWSLVGTDTHLNTASATFSLESPDGDEGYPGAVTVSCTYLLDAEACTLAVTFSATTTTATPINICNHAYWNLSGFERPAMDMVLQSPCTRVVEVDGCSIPTGRLPRVAGTPFDFRVARRLGDRLLDVDNGPGMVRGYDHCLVLGDGDVKEKAGPPAGAGAAAGRGPSDASGTKLLRRIATLSDPGSGLHMHVRTTQPGVQLYTANWLPRPPEEGQVEGRAAGQAAAAETDARFAQYGAVCLETQHFPDSINRKGEFPSVILRPGEEFEETTVFGFERASRG